MSEQLQVKVVSARKRAASIKIQRRRQRLIVFYNTAKGFTVAKAAEALGVTRFTVWRDLAFLRAHDLLSPKKKPSEPFVLAESASEFCRRFNEAHRVTA